MPKDDDRLCSEHFVYGFPFLPNPYPTLNLGHNHEDKKFCKPKRPAPKDRSHGVKDSQPSKKVKLKNSWQESPAVDHVDAARESVPVPSNEAVPQTCKSTAMLQMYQLLTL